MKKISLISAFLLSMVNILAQSIVKEINQIVKIEICAIEYDAVLYIPPLFEELQEIGLHITTACII